MVTNKSYLIDSNALIEPYRQYYAFDLAPTFWGKLKNELEKENIIVLDKVWKEVEKGGIEDTLSNWLNNNKDSIKVVKYKNPEIIENYAMVLRYLQSSGFYTEKAIDEWSREDVADPWLIATAKTYNFTIVTNEVKSGGISEKQRNKRARIPDVAKALAVESINLYEMMRRIGMII